MNADGQSACIQIRSERTIKPELRGQYLNGLKKLMLPMEFLKTDDVVVLGKPSEVVVLFSAGELWWSG